jgi:hypothetical protein
LSPLQAIFNYARLTRKHQSLPIALYVSFVGGNELNLQKVVAMGIRDYGVVLQILTLFPAYCSK